MNLTPPSPPSPPMNPAPRLVSWLVWGGIALVIAAIAVGYVRERQQQGGAFPVLREVTPFSLTDQHGNTVTRESLLGKVWLAEIIFTRCPGPCLAMSRELAALQQELPPGDDLRFVSLTADPEFDTPAVLKKYSEGFGIDTARWHLLAGTKTNLYTLALRGLLLSVEENPDAKENVKLDDLFLHSTRLVLVDRRGQMRAYFDGDGTGPRAKIIAAVQKLLKEK